MPDPSDLDDQENWAGGFYELAIDVGPTDDGRLERALTALWRIAAIEGCFARTNGKRPQLVAVPVSLSSLQTAGHLRGVVTLPADRVSVCGVVAMREGIAGTGHSDWLILYVPLGALARIDPRIGGFPFDDRSGAPSLLWRRPLDAWLADIGTRLYAEVAFELALIGMEPLGGVHAEELRAGIPQDRMHGVLAQVDGKLRYYQPSS